MMKEGGKSGMIITNPKKAKITFLEMQIESKDNKSTSNDNGLARATGLISVSESFRKDENAS